MSISFGTPVINQFHIKGVPTLGDYAERFFDFGQARYVVANCNGNTIKALEDSSRAPIWEIALKVAVCVLSLFTVPLAMLIIKCVYRKQYTFVELPQRAYNPNVIAATPSSHQAANYQLNDVVARIKQLVAEGKKMCLIIGRTDAEPLPDESDPDTCWVSLDIQSTGQIPPDRLHLWLNFTNNTMPSLDSVMEDIQGLFDKVCVDISVWHRLAQLRDSPMRKCFSLLKPDQPTSELIFEKSITPSFDNLTWNSNKPVCNEYGYTLPIRDAENNEMSEKCEKDVIDIITSKLQKLFDSVELVEGEVYPHQYSPCIRPYFHAKGTKPADAAETFFAP